MSSSEYDGIGAQVNITVFGRSFAGEVVRREGDGWVISIPALLGTQVYVSNEEMKGYMS